MGWHEDFEDETYPLEMYEPEEDYHCEEPEEDYHCEEPDQFRDDAEADADVLRNCGWGTDEDYGGIPDDCPW